MSIQFDNKLTPSLEDFVSILRGSQGVDGHLVDVTSAGVYSVEALIQLLENTFSETFEELIAKNSTDTQANSDAIDALDGRLDTNRLYSDSQYLALKAKADSLQVKCNTLQAEVYTDDPILQYGAVEIIGDGYEADDTPIDISTNVVDGKLDMEQKGLTIRNLSVEGQTFQTTGYARTRGRYRLENGHKYYVSVTRDIVSGTVESGANGMVVFSKANNFMLLQALSGSWTRQNVVTFSGVTGDYGLTFYGTADGIVNWNKFMFVDLTALGLGHITDTDILAKLLPYVDGTQNVGKMGMGVVGRNLFDKSKVQPKILDGYLFGNVIFHETETGIEFTSYSGHQGVMIPVKLKKNTSYYLNYTNANVRWLVKPRVGTQNIATIKTSSIPATFTTTDYEYYWIIIDVVDVAGTYNVANIMLNLGSSVLPYEPYQEQTIFLPSIGNSLPNGVADSIKTVADGWEHTKRVNLHTITSEEIRIVERTNINQARIQIEPDADWNSSVTSPILSPDYIWVADAGYDDVQNIGRFITYGPGYFALIISKSDSFTDAQAELTGKTLYYQLAEPITTKHDLPLPTSGKTIHRFAGEEKIALYDTGLTFSENVFSVLSAIKFVAGVMTDITSLATITGATVTFSGVYATDVVYVKVEHSVNRPLGVLEHAPAVSNTASRLEELEGAYEIIEDDGVQYTQFN